MSELPPSLREKLLTPAVLHLMQLIKNAGGEARLVGGAVRDALLARMVGDSDLATTLPPAQVMESLAEAGVKTVATGLAHGTVTAIIDHAGYEITTLRRDISTDGRHADVAFTDNWQEDAARRDFTFNALYVDRHGQLYDYFAGSDDAQAGRVRFIGDARTRIQEDVLRILRFFRFYAWFGRGEPDADGLKACEELAHLLPRLSAERMQKEIFKLLQAPNPWNAWLKMHHAGVVAEILPETTSDVAFMHLMGYEGLLRKTEPPITRLSALLPGDESVAGKVALRLKLSARDRDQLILLAKLSQLLPPRPSRLELRRLFYFYGASNVRSALLCDFHYDNHELGKILSDIDQWTQPVFPVAGKDLLALGIPAGPQVGVILEKLEQKWIASDFTQTKEKLLAEITKYVKNH